jgi:RNA polymerase sigma-70 factor, ECF subfamily
MATREAQEVRKLGPDAAPPTPAEFTSLYRAQIGYVWSSLRRLGVRDADLEDVAHDVLATAYRRWSDYDPTRPLRPWLFGIAYRVASDFRRRAHHLREVFEDEPTDIADDAEGMDVRLSGDQDRVLLQQAIDCIDEGRRAVFVMHELNGHTMPEIADALGIPLNTAYSRLRLARADLTAAVKRLRTQRGDL